MYRKMIGFWCTVLFLLDLKIVSTQPMQGPHMYYENGPPPHKEQSSLMGKFPSIFDFLREPFGNGSLFSSSLPGFLQRSPPPPPHYRHPHHPDHPPPSHPPPSHYHLKMSPSHHRPHGQLHRQASFIHPIIREFATTHKASAPFKNQREPYNFEPIVSFQQKPEQEQGNLSSAELMSLEATLREKIAEQTQGLSTMASQISTVTLKPIEKDQIQDEARASSITLPTVKNTTKAIPTIKTTEKIQTAETSDSSNNNATDQLLTQAESYQQPRHADYSQTPAKPYSFSYVVKNKYGNDFNQEEHSDGSTVRGQYRTLLPDGRIQTVMYIADKIHGYNAVVTYEGTAKHPESDNYKIKTKYEPNLRPLPTPIARRPATVTFPQINNNYPVPQSNYGVIPRVRPVPVAVPVRAVVNSNGYSSDYVSPILLARPASAGRFLNPAPQSSTFYRQQQQTNSHSLNTVYNNQGHYSQNNNQYVEFPRYANRFPDPGMYRNPLRARPHPHSMNRPIQKVPVRGFRRPVQSLIGVSNHNHPTVLKPITQQQQQQEYDMNQHNSQHFFNQGHPLNAILTSGQNVVNNNPQPVMTSGIQQQHQQASSSLSSSTSSPLELLKLELPSGDRSKLFETVPLPLPYPLVHAKIPQSNLITHDNKQQTASRQQKSSSSTDNHHYTTPEEQESIKNENEYNDNDKDNDDLNAQLDQMINLDALKNAIFEQEEQRNQQQHPESSSSPSNLNPTQFQFQEDESSSSFNFDNPIIQHLNNIRGMDKTGQLQHNIHSIPLASEVKVMVMNPLQFQSPHSQRHEKRISEIGKGIKEPPNSSHPAQPHGDKDVEHLFANLVPLTEQIRSQKFNEWFDTRGIIQKVDKRTKKGDRVRKKMSRIITSTSTTTTSSPVADDKNDDKNDDLDLESQFVNIQLNKTNPTAHTSTPFPPFEKAVNNIKLRRIAKRIRKKIRRITVTTTTLPPT